MQQRIIDATHRSIKSLIEMFQAEPTRYFTENDLVCNLHRLLHVAIADEGADIVPDRDNLTHGLIHCEYPTPFRCDMGGTRFEIKTDEDRTERGKRFQRGHYDLVILNPAFISNHSYPTIKAQDYSLIQSSVLTSLTASEPVVLFGIELVFCRDEIKPSRGKNWEKAALEFVAGVRQDTAKLRVSRSEEAGQVRYC